MLKIGPVDGGGAGLRFTSLLLCVYDHLMKFGGCMVGANVLGQPRAY